MHQLYKKNSEDNRAVVAIGLGIATVLFFLLHFRSPLLQIPLFRDKAVASFMKDIKKTQQFDIQKLWELRDRLGAVITYNQDYLNPQSILEFKQIPYQSVQLFEYQGKGLESKEYLILLSEKDFMLRTRETETVFFTDDSTNVLFDPTHKTVRILTVLPFEQMKKHNGMIDYRELKQDLNDRLWFTSTVITVSPAFSVEAL